MIRTTEHKQYDKDPDGKQNSVNIMRDTTKRIIKRSFAGIMSAVLIANIIPIQIINAGSLQPVFVIDTKGNSGLGDNEGAEGRTTAKSVDNVRDLFTSMDYPSFSSEIGKDSSSTVGETLEDTDSGVGILFGRKTRAEYLEAKEASEGACWGYTNLGISNVSDNLNIRAIAGEDGKLVGKLPKNAACEVLDEDGDWFHIKSGDVEGYVKGEYLLTGLQAKMRVREFATDVVKVGTDGLNVREAPSTDALIVTQVATGEILDYVGTEGDWVAVMLDDETVYVSADYVEVTSELATALTMTEVLYGAGVSDVRAAICNYGLQFVGNRYVWGGTSLTKGTDCSGFTMSVYKNFGIRIPRTSQQQAKAGIKISLSEAKAGDLVFYSNGRRINHVALYLGNGQVVHASNPRSGIKISNGDYRTPVKVVRFIQD